MPVVPQRYFSLKIDVAEANRSSDEIFNNRDGLFIMHSNLN